MANKHSGTRKLSTMSWNKTHKTAVGRMVEVMGSNNDEMSVEPVKF